MENEVTAWEGYGKMDKLFILYVDYPTEYCFATDKHSILVATAGTLIDLSSSVLPVVDVNCLPSPTADLPLGIPFPGSTYSDDQKPNWVGHLIQTWAPEKPLLVYNFAQGGDTIGNMKRKIDGPYQEIIKTKCKPGEHWSPANSLFVFWIGINNMRATFGPEDIELFMGDLFKCVQTVYDTGARAFLFIDIPPVQRAPLIVINNSMSQRFASVCVAWNKGLDENIQMFSNTHPDVRCFQFSSYKCLNNILDHPVKHGFTEEDVTEYGGAIWVDNIHLTGAVHEIIAQDVWQYLMTI